MEKRIKIESNTNTNNTNKNHTKKKDDLLKKAEINAIMEKYNLKVPKKSKLNINKTDYIVNPKSESQIIHITKTGPLLDAGFNKSHTQNNTSYILKEPVNILKDPINILKNPVNISKDFVNISKDPIFAISQKSHPQTELVNIYPKNISLQNKINLSHSKDNSFKEQSVSSLSRELELQKPSVQNIINDDKKEIEQKKMEMPKAIISKNIVHPKNFLSSSNIYNIIPTIKPPQPNSNFQNKPSQQIHIKNKLSQQILSQQIPSQQIPIKNKPSQQIPSQQIPFQQISIQNKPSHHKSIIQHGTGNANINTFKKVIINPKLSLDESQTYKGELYNNNNNNNKKPFLQTQNNNTLLSTNIESTQHVKTISTSRYKNFIQNENTSAILNDLELRRKVLQEQQEKELAKLKYKKEQIQKIHNRKKEIELMKSINHEKQKLRIIQNKQIELNNIITKQIQQNGGLHQNENSNLSQTQKHIIYNVDAKKTKKQYYENFSQIIKKKEIDKEKIINADKIDKADKIEIPIIKKEKARGNLGSFAEGTLVSSLPYIYYNKKNKPDIKWPSKAELYDNTNFTKNLTIALNIQPVFGNKKILNDKTTLDERKIILQKTYNFNNINKFKDNIIHIIYKTLEHDKIILVN